MKKQLEELKSQYRRAKTEAERAKIIAKAQTLADKDNEAFGEAMLGLARKTRTEAHELAMREQMKEVLPMVSLSYIAKHYFNKSRAWICQKVNGNLVNGKIAGFTAGEIETLNRALYDMGQKLQATHLS